MAWIPCDGRLFTNPMTARLAGKMGWTINSSVGTILRLWCWCIDFAPDGDLRPFAPGEIASALGESPLEGEKIVTALIECQWLETTPYFRVARWWEIAGLFLRGRVKREPVVWKLIEKLYSPTQEDPLGVEQSAKVADPSPASGEPVPAPEQLRSSSGAAPELLSPNLQHPNQSYQNITDLNLQQQHQPPQSAELSIDSTPSAPTGGLSATAIAKELCDHAGPRRYSLKDIQKFQRLARTYGEKFLKACRSLHGGVVNVPASMEAILEGKDPPMP